MKKRAPHPKRNEYQKRYRKKHPQAVTAKGCGYRSRKAGIECDVAYLRGMKCPENCPVLGYPISFGNSYHGKGSIKNMASFDRKDHEKGYIEGNVQIISMLANGMKQNASRAELVAFSHWVLST